MYRKSSLLDSLTAGDHKRTFVIYFEFFTQQHIKKKVTKAKRIILDSF